MQLSKPTVDILKNFATINSNLVIKEGKVIATMSAAKDIMAEFSGEDEFDEQVSIFNLNEFLGVLSAFEKPELELGAKQVTISQGRQKVQYLYADDSLLITPKKSITFPGTDVELLLTESTLTKLQKMAAILSVEDFAVVGNGETVSLKVFDKKNPSANQFEIETDVETDKEFVALFKIEKMKLLSGDYNVEISKKGISKFTHSDMKLFYYVAVEADSTI